MTEAPTNWDWPQRKANRVMLGIIVVSTVLFSWLAFLQYDRFTTETHEVMYQSYALAHTDFGRWLPLYFVDGGSYWGSHMSVQWALLLPLYKLLPFVPVLFIAQSLFISASAWPLYLLARHKLNDNFAAVAVATAYLLFPPVVSQHLNQIHDDQFANVWLMLAAYLFVRERLGWCLLSLLLVSFSKEYFGLTGAMFGLWALLERRNWKWVLGPVVVGLGSFLFIVKVIMPMFQGPGNLAYGSLWVFVSKYGKSGSEVWSTLVNSPGYILSNTFGPVKLGYLFAYFGPVLWVLPFLAPAGVLMIPNLGMNLISTNESLTELRWHYSVLLGAATFIALVCGLPRVRDWLCRRLGPGHHVKFIAAALVFTSLLSYRIWFFPEAFLPHPSYRTLHGIIRNIPRKAKVVCPGPMLAHFTNHKAATTLPEVLVRFKFGAWSNFTPYTRETRDLWRQGTSALLEYDYVILDSRWRGLGGLAQEPAFDWLKGTNAFRLVHNAEGVFVFERVRPPAP
jgi:uncharacterized membrane protein